MLSMLHLTLGSHFSCSTRCWTNQQQQSANHICWSQWRKSSSHPGLWCEICGLANACAVEVRLDILVTFHNELLLMSQFSHLWSSYRMSVNFKTAWYIHYTYLGGASYTPNCFDAYNFQLSGVKLFDLQIWWPNLAFWIVLHQAACSIICICHIILAGG